MVEVLREARRVLRPDGVAWVNMGDSYAGGRGHGTSRYSLHAGAGKLPLKDKERPHHPRQPGIKPKDLIGQPWALAFALRADGWYLRQGNIWNKQNPMPETATDRPKTCHEFVFQLTKSARYYYDPEAVKEKASLNSHSRGHGLNTKAVGIVRGSGIKQNNDFSVNMAGLVSQRDLRSVWTMASEPLRDEHYAAFPSRLPRTCILASTSEAGACAACGAPWRRILEKGKPDLAHRKASGGSGPLGLYDKKAKKDYRAAKAQDAAAVKARILAGMVEKRTIGWAPTCACGTTERVPCVVADPFMGSGTVAVVAEELGRSWVGAELSPKSLAIAERRAGRVAAQGRLDLAPVTIQSPPPEPEPDGELLL